MSESRRVQRVEKELRLVVGEFLLRGLKGPVDGIVSVERVIASKDLRTAKVFLSIMGGEEGAEQEVVEDIQAQAPRVQAEVGRRLRMKFCPRIKFTLDPGRELRMKVEGLLHEIEISSNNDDESTD